ncbi:MAG: hypothetical protein ACFE89_06030 [Candidatus Hodarchaeota archaeon]
MDGRRVLWLGFVVGTLLLLCGSASWAPPSVAAVVWADDFNDGNFAGWTIAYGAFSAADNTLRGDSSGWNYAYHSSIVAEGTWHFDVYHSGADLCPYVWFITNDLFSEGANNPYNGYYLHFTLISNAIELCRDTEMQGYDYILDSYHPSNGIAGWWHLDVTRDSSGNIHVYINETLQLQAQDTNFDTSQYLYFECYDHHALENVVVSDTVDIEPPSEPPTTPTTTTTPTFIELVALALIIGIPITVVAFNSLILFTKSKNDE